jgi:two-component system phosphate regulon sensor histidine kinase PhoR
MVLVFPIKSPSGEIHAFLVMGEKKADTLYFNDDIDLLNTVSTAAALTIDRIKLQQDLILEHLEAERLKELNEVKSLFVSSMVHELKKPLSGIKMFTELLQFKGNDTPDSEKKYLSIIDGESEKLKRLINNILDNALIEKGIKNYQMKKLELNSVIRRITNESEYLFRMKKQEIDVNLTYEKIFVLGDEQAIESMLVNLITNASKYSPENAKTTVSSSVVENQITIEIKDEGKGIAENELEKIFQPYFRIKEKSTSMVDGTGLGLSIVKHIVDAHKGKIQVESTLDKGTAFRITFPLLNN